jgi:thiol-disulfide isomerase/thioredoxin
MPLNVRKFALLFLFFAVVYAGFVFVYNSSQNETSEVLPSSEYVSDVLVKDDTLVLKSSTPKVILVHAAWCGHCKQMMPAFLNAAKAFPGVEWIRVGDEAAKEFSKRMDMKGFPSIYGVSVNGNVKQHQGGRNEQQLIDFAKSL